MTSGLLASFEEKDEKIELSQVPEVVLKAAQEAVQGIEINGAEIEKTEGGIIYELEGTVEGKIYEIEITPEGKVLQVEEEDREEGETDEGDDDDNDDDDKNA
jgi:hypothetical protein